MFQQQRMTSSGRKLPLLFLSLLLLVTFTCSAASDTFLRGLQSQACKDSASSICPLEQPLPGDKCCYEPPTEGTNASQQLCSYDHVYQWSSDCSSINCVPVAFCSCENIDANVKNSNGKARGKGQWVCAMARRNLSMLPPDACHITAETEALASEIGKACNPV